MAPRDAASYATARQAMVREQLEARGISDPQVLAAMASLPRERFVGPELAGRAYEDRALTIGGGQTISQPYIVARMSEALGLSRLTDPAVVTLDVGTGSGYQAAVLAAMGARVVSIERDPDLAIEAAQRLASLGLGSVEVVEGDGSEGWPDAAPYAGIIVGAAAPGVPPPLQEQLADG
ncbi:MAG TPA: protein-L-isoaspartate O-methyltransferase, partial [Candidatus Limnocylindrales bacterium]|nr:protein-L-isoaspartate O-methyltransferase [Candidatus Limnocylindrales bacterium]